MAGCVSNQLYGSLQYGCRWGLERIWKYKANNENKSVYWDHFSFLTRSGEFCFIIDGKRGINIKLLRFNWKRSH